MNLTAEQTEKFELALVEFLRAMEDIDIDCSKIFDDQRRILIKTEVYEDKDKNYFDDPNDLPQNVIPKEEIDERLIALYQYIVERSDRDSISDIDEFSDEMREIVLDLESDGFVRTWINGAIGISFTCWNWTSKALNQLHKAYPDQEIIDPEED